MIINTINTKQQQLEKGYFSIGSGKETILIIGSCRSVPYCQYLSDWNEVNGNIFTVCFIDPFNWNFDLQDNRTDFESIINSLEKHEGLLELFKKTDYFLHEWYAHFGMFNCDKNAEKNIYKFGMSPKMDVSIPAFNDLFIMFADIVTFDADMRKKATADFNVLGKLSYQTELELYSISQKYLQKFYNICALSDLPEMKLFFEITFKDKRLFWTSNHVSREFTLAVFKLMNDKFLHLDLSIGFNENHEDMFANNYTELTNYDIKWYDYNWGETIIPLRTKL